LVTLLYLPINLDPHIDSASPATAVTSTFGNPVGIGTIALLLVVLPWSLGQCNVAGTNAVSYTTLAPPLIFCGFVRERLEFRSGARRSG